MVETTANYPNGQGGRQVNDNPQPDTWRSSDRFRHEVPEERKEYTRPLFTEDTPRDLVGMVYELLDIWYDKLHRNKVKYAYYDGKNKLKDFGISTPPELLDVETVVGWPQKAVDALAVRSRFDGFTAGNEELQDELDELSERSHLRVKYRQAVTSTLIYSCSFVTVGLDENGDSVIQLHSAETASAVWDEQKGRIAYGLIIEDWDRRGIPTELTLHLDDAAVHCYRDQYIWRMEEEPHSMGRPVMEAIVYRPTYRKPFGQSRISRSVMSLTDSAVRAALGGDIAFQFAVAPQKYLLGADKDALEGKTRWEAYIGNIFAVSSDEDGNKPSYGQLPQASMQQYTDFMRSLAARFSSETNVPLAQLGVNSDANPSSAQAIYAANEPLIIECQDLNEGARDSLRTIALMCIAADNGKSFDSLSDEDKDFVVNFANPAMPSIVSQADAMVKIASVVPDFAGTDLFFEQIGFTEDMRKKAVSDINRNRGAFSLSVALSDQAVSPDLNGNTVDDMNESIAATALKGSQMNAIVQIMNRYSAGEISESQAVNTISALTGVSRERARDMLLGDENVTEVVNDSVEQVM